MGNQDQSKQKPENPDHDKQKQRNPDHGKQKPGKQDQRAIWHDYKSPGRYMITLLKGNSPEQFSTIDCERQIKEWERGVFSTNWTRTGKVIADSLYNIRNLNPYLTTEQYVIMPDHVHFILAVNHYLDDVLGNYIARFKAAVNNIMGMTGIFDSGFNDQIVTPQRNLNDLYQYIRSNPYRYAVRRLHPEFFRKQRNILISGKEMQAYGNLFLLRNPFKISLVVHRADNDDVFNRKREECLYTAANGGVVVSAFISPREKEIRREVEAMNGKIILIHNRIFKDREKPERHNFNLCTEGRLLLLCPMAYQSFPSSEHPSRRQCLEMNSIAEALASDTSGLFGKMVEMREDC